MVKDPTSNLIISLKNASSAKKGSVQVPYSRMNMDILSVLEKEGFVASVDKTGKEDRKHIEVVLKYEKGSPVISDVKRISKFSCRVYQGVKDIKPIRHGFGLLVLSTPHGIISGAQAHKLNTGGEALFEIW